MELVNLSGTIPVRYRGSIYNIPICIWLIDTHPKNAPICYVKPTLDMSIKVSMFVDNNGKIYLPYLHEWVPVSILYFEHIISMLKLKNLHTSVFIFL